MATEPQQASPNLNGLGLPANGEANIGIKSEQDTAMTDSIQPSISPNPSAPPAPTTPTPTNNASTMPTRNNAADTPSLGSVMPTQATPHGAPTRRYMNEKITRHLLEGMKRVAIERPRQPLRFLGEFLLERSRQVESVVDSADGVGSAANVNNGNA
ncbi:hypothetical protein MMC10_005529 [Thelotrema lepadinum]|nr:hypothetical protein [Thelotrema lepadinum]